MKLVFATRTRSGSQFLMRIATAITGGLPQPLSVISPGRNETFIKENAQALKNLRRDGKLLEYFDQCSIQSVNVEDPAIDFLGFSLASRYPEARWLTAFRRLDDIITSHHNIRSWGKPEEGVLHSFVTAIELFEHLARQGRLFVVNVDAPGEFSLERMCAFLGCEPTPEARRFAGNWPRINTLEYQRKKFGEEATEREIPPQLSTLRERHPWIERIEARYTELWKNCS